MTPTEKQIIVKGNEMLAQAGMPPLTPEQEKLFLQKRRERNAFSLERMTPYVLTGLFGYWLGAKK